LLTASRGNSKESATENNRYTPEQVFSKDEKARQELTAVLATTLVHANPT